MRSQTLIQPARVDDSEAIAALMRERVTGYGRITMCDGPHLAQFLADEPAMGGSEEYVMGTKQVCLPCSLEATTGV